jgi:hypothetical protein
LLDLLALYLDRDAENPTIDGFEVKITAASVKCPWLLGAKRVEKSERFALEAMRLGYVVADLEHAKMLGASDFAVGGSSS